MSESSISQVGATERSLHCEFSLATNGDALAIAHVRWAAADHLTEYHGGGPWSRHTSERAVISGMRHAKVLLARVDGTIVATCRLATRRPWAIDASLFRRVQKPIYLTDMAVLPAFQRLGAGRALVKNAIAVARTWLGDAIRLDAYEAAAGAGEFYSKCGFTNVGSKVFRTAKLTYFELLLMPETVL